MFIRTPEAHSRSLVKAISWRIVGSIDTFIISFFVTHHLGAAASIASVETFTKIMLFYGHERAWGSVKWGRETPAPKGETLAQTVTDVPATGPARA